MRVNVKQDTHQGKSERWDGALDEHTLDRKLHRGVNNLALRAHVEDHVREFVQRCYTGAVDSPCFDEVVVLVKVKRCRRADTFHILFQCIGELLGKQAGGRRPRTTGGLAAHYVPKLLYRSRRQDTARKSEDGEETRDK